MDVVDANIKASTSDKVGGGDVINIGRGVSYSVTEVAALIGGETEDVGDRLEPRQTLADNTRAKELLDWTPKVDLKDWLSPDSP